MNSRSPLLYAPTLPVYLPPTHLGPHHQHHFMQHSGLALMRFSDLDFAISEGQFHKRTIN